MEGKSDMTNRGHNLNDNLTFRQLTFSVDIGWRASSLAHAVGDGVAGTASVVEVRAHGTHCHSRPCAPGRSLARHRASPGSSTLFIVKIRSGLEDLLHEVQGSEVRL